MKDGNKKKEEQVKLTPEQENGWYKLWKFANENIDTEDCAISYQDFVNEGKKLFEIKIKKAD